MGTAIQNFGGKAAKIRPTEHTRAPAYTPPKGKLTHEPICIPQEEYAHCFLIQVHYTPIFIKIQAICKKQVRVVDYDKTYVNIVMLTRLFETICFYHFQLKRQHLAVCAASYR